MIDTCHLRQILMETSRKPAAGSVVKVPGSLSPSTLWCRAPSLAPAAGSLGAREAQPVLAIQCLSPSPLPQCEGSPGGPALLAIQRLSPSPLPQCEGSPGGPSPSWPSSASLPGGPALLAMQRLSPCSSRSVQGAQEPRPPGHPAPLSLPLPQCEAHLLLPAHPALRGRPGRALPARQKGGCQADSCSGQAGVEAGPAAGRAPREGEGRGGWRFTAPTCSLASGMGLTPEDVLSL